MERVHIGTSGWSCKHWKGNFYPQGLKQSAWLAYYAQHFAVTEINGSFYRLPSEATVVKWIKSVPQNFIFCPKISRYLTHLKKLREPEEPLERFFDVFEPMTPHLGPVLVQLPHHIKFDYDVAEHFFKLLYQQYRRYRFVVEVRHPSWLHHNSLTLMAKYKVGLVIAQSGNRFPYSEIVTAENVYVRFHGPAELYASPYKEEDLQYFAEKFKQWIKEGQVVWAFFNNDVHGYAPQDAHRLQQYFL